MKGQGGSSVAAAEFQCPIVRRKILVMESYEKDLVAIAPPLGEESVII